MKRTFEEFLKEWHAKDYQGTDDGMPDAFEAWLEALEIGDIEQLANVYGKEMFLAGVNQMGDRAVEIIKDMKL